MKFIISFVTFDTTVDDTRLGHSSTTSGVHHEIISALAPEYSACESIRDIEVAFEAVRNYTNSNDHLTRPQSKVKVLKVDELPVEP